ncbi:MAG: Rieske (2Fe-2S) protein [Armatimonadetes bacterium]|nr:Rieske (2Fe-2S) protein [Armatimonadota bacterium]
MSEPTSLSPAPPPDPRARRRFLGWTASLSSLTAALMLVPGLAAFLGPLVKLDQGGDWVSLGPESEFGEERKVVPFTYARQDGWFHSLQTRQIVVWKGAEGWVAISTECTHAGCAVQWKKAESKFHCPCHGAEFDQNGSVTKPPADRALARLPIRVNPQSRELEVKES